MQSYILLHKMLLCVCVRVCLSVVFIEIHSFAPNCPKIGVCGALKPWEGHEHVGFAVRPPTGMCQILEPGKPKFAYI